MFPGTSRWPPRNVIRYAALELSVQKLETLDYRNDARERRRAALAVSLGRNGRGIGCAATLLPLPFLYSFARVPVGTSMRPMELTLILFLCAAAGLFIALPLGIASLALARPGHFSRRIGMVAVTLSLTAIFSSFALFAVISSARHYVMEP